MAVNVNENIDGLKSSIYFSQVLYVKMNPRHVWLIKLPLDLVL